MEMMMVCLLVDRYLHFGDTTMDFGRLIVFCFLIKRGV